LIKVPKIVTTLGLGSILVLLIISCATSDRPFNSEVEPLQTGTSSPTPRTVKTPNHMVIPHTDYPLCSSTTVGSETTCQIPRDFYSYKPGLKGSPTFCNDAHYPNHSFTLLVWGQDWSDYDGQCLIVSGMVTVYNGKPQIEAGSRSQVTGSDQ